MTWRLPPAFSDQTALQEAYTVFRINGICAASLFAGAVAIGSIMDMTTAGADAKIRYAVIVSLSLEWAMGMLGSTFLIEARRLQLWIRERNRNDFWKTAAMNVAIFFTLAGVNLIAASLIGIGLIGWLTIRSGLVI